MSPKPKTHFWQRLAAWIEALEPPTYADEADHMRRRIAVLERELAELKAPGPNAQKA